MSQLTVAIRILPEGQGLPIPTYMTEGSAGCDLFAAVQDPITLVPGARELVSAGFCMALPGGYEAQIRPRSGLAIKHGVTCLNAPGTIDSDYRGPICVVLINLGTQPFLISRGDRIAQMIVAGVERATFDVADELSVTPRAAGGFGSTGARG